MIMSSVPEVLDEVEFTVPRCVAATQGSHVGFS